MKDKKPKTIQDLIDSGEATEKMIAAYKSNPSYGNVQVLDSDRARELQKKSYESRMRNIKLREEKLQLQLEAMEIVNKDVLTSKMTAAKGLDVMKYLMMKAMINENYKEAATLASQIAEYEDYKLGRTEAVSYNLDMAKLSDDQLTSFIEGKISEHELKVIEDGTK